MTNLDKRLKALESTRQPSPRNTNDTLSAFFEMLQSCRDIFNEAIVYEADEMERQKQWTMDSYHRNSLNRMQSRLDMWQAITDVLDTIGKDNAFTAQDTLALLIQSHPDTLSTFTHGKLKFEYGQKLFNHPHYQQWERIRDNEPQ